ncbi:MAG: histidinol dehydrogenase [Bacteroidales bacterium]
MRIVLNPPEKEWELLFRRSEMEKAWIEEKVRNILTRVRSEGDNALFEFSEKYDGVRPENLKVSIEEISESAKLIPQALKDAISVAKENIEKFHSAQLFEEPVTETSGGVKCWRKNVAIGRVGIYVPGGSAPLFSTVLMLAVPAKIAGCQEIIMCTPPDSEGKVNPLILYAAFITGITSVYRCGGAQAIAAMAFGTESIPGVDKIFGPGNQYVTKAKEMVQLYGVPVDMPAGPSELLIIADETGDPEFIAADLLSQAEHGIDSQVFLLTDSEAMTGRVREEVIKQVQQLPRQDIALKALEHSALILLNSLSDCIRFSNLYAPEHLIIAASDPASVAEDVVNAGSVFLGNYSCESAGDYATGTNHTLPTSGFARNFSGVSVESFMKKISFQEVTAEGIKNIGPVVELMAEAEMLAGHKNAVSVRLNRLKNV